MNNKKIFFWSISVALSGFLFGFDTVVISGANLPIRELWNTSPLFHGVFIMSMALWGTVIGALLGSYPCDKLGRKKTLLIIGLTFFNFSSRICICMGSIFFFIFQIHRWSWSRSIKRGFSNIYI